jgi:hypothetical protein
MSHLEQRLEFNLVEITQNNEIVVRYIDIKQSEDLGARRFVRDVVKHHNYDNMPEFAQLIYDSFPYAEPSLPDGVHEVATMVRILADENRRHMIRYNLVKQAWENGEIVAVEKAGKPVVTCLCDLSEHPEKVQRVAEIVFTDEVKAKAQAEKDEAERIAALPDTVEVEAHDREGNPLGFKIEIPNPEKRREIS